MAYHINLATGEPGLCRARKQCPFAPSTEHFAAEEDARQLYENVMEGKRPPPLSWLLSSKSAALQSEEDESEVAKRLNEEFKEVEASLGEDVSTIYYYTSGGYGLVNGVLRQTPSTLASLAEDGPSEEAFYLKHVANHVEVLDKLFADQLPKQRVVYRAVEAWDEQEVKAIIDSYVQAGEVHDEGFMSTSATPDFPLYMAKKKKGTKHFLLEIAVEKSVSLQADDAHKAGDVQSLENEVLLPRGGRFEVVGVEMRKKVKFGNMKEKLVAHGDRFSGDGIKDIARNEDFFVPVVKLVQKVA